jgi:hypothetical protein
LLPLAAAAPAPAAGVATGAAPVLTFNAPLDGVRSGADIVDGENLLFAFNEKLAVKTKLLKKKIQKKCQKRLFRLA